MKTNSLIFKCSKVAADGTQFDIKVRLDDECKNGHADFSITGTSYAAGKIKCERNMICSGAMGDEIAKEFPEFAIFDRLHLCDFNGAPMYAVGNGLYNLKRLQVAEFCKYFRCTPAERAALAPAESKEDFAVILYKSDIPARWKKEADEARALLEKWTGDTFEYPSTRSNFTPPTPEQIEAFEARQKEGYYTPEAKKQRADKQATDARAAQFAAIAAERDKATNKADQEYKVKHAVLTAGLPIDNFIYYNHTATGVFNWLDYGEKITPEQFAAAALSVDGVTFQIKK